MPYIVISRCEDEPHIRFYATKEDFVADLNESIEDGIDDFIVNSGDIPQLEEWPCRTSLVIKGEIVVPKAKLVINKLDVQ